MLAPPGWRINELGPISGSSAMVRPTGAPRRHTGRTDIPLTERGRFPGSGRLRKACRRDVHQGPVLSPVARPRHRAPCRVRRSCDDGQRSPRMGLRGSRASTTPEIREQDPGWTIWRGGVTGGEPAADVATRVDRVISSVRGLGGDGDVLAFAHGHLLRVLAARWLGLPPEDGGLFALSTAIVRSSAGNMGSRSWSAGMRPAAESSAVGCAESWLGAPGSQPRAAVR